MSYAIDHKRIKQVTKASLLEMPDDIKPITDLFNQRKKIAEQILKNSGNELILMELNKLFDHANEQL